MNEGTVDISGLDRTDVLRALYNRAQPQGMGFLQYDAAPMSRETAEGIIASFPPGPLYFDYVKGRVMKVLLDPDRDDFRAANYDRDNGEGAASEVISALRATGDPANAEILSTHEAATILSAAETMGLAGTSTVLDDSGEYPVFTLGMPAEAGHAAAEVAR